MTVCFSAHTLSASLSLSQCQFQMTEHSADSSVFRNYCWWRAAFWRLCFGVFEASLVPWEQAAQHTCSWDWISFNVSLGSADPAAWELTDTAQWRLWSADHLQKGGVVMDTQNVLREETQKRTRNMETNSQSHVHVWRLPCSIFSLICAISLEMTCDTWESAQKTQGFTTSSKQKSCQPAFLKIGNSSVT